MSDSEGKDGIKCRLCGHTETKIIDSRPGYGGTRRRRKCSSCGDKVTTFEYVIDESIYKEKPGSPYIHRATLAATISRADLDNLINLADEMHRISARLIKARQDEAP